MTDDQVKRTLSGISPNHDFARAVVALINGSVVADLNTISAPADLVSERTREHTSGRLAAMLELKHRLSAMWAKTVEPPPPDIVG